MIKEEKLYSLEDIMIIPQKVSTINSRKECNPLTGKIEDSSIKFFPLIASPMDSVVDEETYLNYWRSGISCVLPRTVSLEKRLKLCKEVFCSFSLLEIKSESIDKTVEGPLFVLIDIANGHMLEEISLGGQLKQKYSDTLKLMGGNIANPETYIDYNNSDFDFIRVGIGGGNCCTTSTQVSIHHPYASLIDKISDIRKNINGKTKIIADGGISEYRDVIKCLALGADYVMMGKTFAKTRESAGDFFYKNEFGDLVLVSKNDSLIGYPELWKEYKGMSTKEAQAKILGKNINELDRKTLKTAEGRNQVIKIEYTLTGWLDNLNSYLRSAMSYCDSRTLEEFKEKAICHVVSRSSSYSINSK